MTTPIQYSGPAISPEVSWDVRVHLQAIYQKLGNHTQAFSLLANKQSGSTTTNTSILENIVTGGGSTPSTPVGIPVNNQSGVTSYATVSGDDGALIVFSDASPVAVSLTTQTPPWSCFIDNQGAGTATLTPATGTNNGAATLAILSGSWALVAFDSVNWWAAALLSTPSTPNFSDSEIVAGSGTSWTFAHDPISALPTSTSVALYVQQYNGGPFIRLPPSAIVSIIGNAMVTADSWTAGALMVDYRY
jgi:hypothetical protein